MVEGSQREISSPTGSSNVYKNPIGSQQKEEKGERKSKKGDESDGERERLRRASEERMVKDRGR